jgi:hypothetical protein
MSNVQHLALLLLAGLVGAVLLDLTFGRLDRIRLRQAEARVRHLEHRLRELEDRRAYVWRGAAELNARRRARLDAATDETTTTPTTPTSSR